jgi:site-specific recombinase XerD
MTDSTGIIITELIDKAILDLYRMQFANASYEKYSRGFREFAEYCENNGITKFNETTGREYFRDRFGLDIADTTQELNKIQLATRCTMRLLDDIYQFGYARRYSHHDYRMPKAYETLLEGYLKACLKKGNANSTIAIKRTKLRDFLIFLAERNTMLADINAADISNFIITLTGFSRITMRIYACTLRCFLRYLKDEEILNEDLSGVVPWPMIYTEESIPETWSVEEIQELLSAVDRTGGVGKRDYAMILLATMLGMRAGDICGLKFENLDWKRKLITYTQQKTGKVQVLPILPAMSST